MDNEITAKRGLILILIIVTMVVFIGLVWLIATYLPMNLLGGPSRSTVTSTTQVLKNCTYPISYWIEHPELYPSRMVFGSKVYEANDIREILTQADQNPAAQLQAQLVGAFLNISAGADQSLIETTIFQAYSWLVQHPVGSEASSSDIETGGRYFSLLDAYNFGLAGVVACEGILTTGPIETTTPSETLTVSLTITLSQTASSTPSETAPPTSQLVTPIYIVVSPTQKPIPTTQSPGGQAPTVTRTPKLTTQAPTLTNTSAPAATATFTEPPPPTSTFTPPPLPTDTYTPPPPP